MRSIYLERMFAVKKIWVLFIAIITLCIIGCTKNPEMPTATPALGSETPVATSTSSTSDPYLTPPPGYTEDEWVAYKRDRGMYRAGGFAEYVQLYTPRDFTDADISPFSYTHRDITHLGIKGDRRGLALPDVQGNRYIHEFVPENPEAPYYSWKYSPETPTNVYCISSDYQKILATIPFKDYKVQLHVVADGVWIYEQGADYVSKYNSSGDVIQRLELPNLDPSRGYDIAAVGDKYFVLAGRLSNPDNTLSSKYRFINLEDGTYDEPDFEAMQDLYLYDIYSIFPIDSARFGFIYQSFESKSTQGAYYELDIYNADTKRIEASPSIKASSSVKEITSPVYSPQEHALYYIGLREHSLYVYDFDDESVELICILPSTVRHNAYMGRGLEDDQILFYDRFDKVSTFAIDKSYR